MPFTFSIITCTWNSASYIDESIASLLAQDYPHIEYIFVDGGSTDGTLDKIKAVPRPYRLIENIRGGVSNAMNVGMRHATGDVVAYLHSDDYYLTPRVLSIVASHFQESGKDWLFGRIKPIINDQLCSENYVSPRYSYAQLLKGNFIPHPSTFVKRELLQRFGGFDTRLKYAMDYDLWLKLGRLSDPLQLDEPFTAFREHDGSLSTKNQMAAMKEDFSVRLAHTGTAPIVKAMHYLRYFVRRQRALQSVMGK